MRCGESRTGEGAVGGTPLLGGGGGGHGKFLNFAYPEIHSGAFSGQKKCLFGGHCKLTFLQEAMYELKCTACARKCHVYNSPTGKMRRVKAGVK